MEYTARLENWFKEDCGVDEFILWGNIFDDKKNRWVDGTQIHTSGIMHRKCIEGDTVTTRNNKYLLGRKWGE